MLPCWNSEDEADLRQKAVNECVKENRAVQGGFLSAGDHRPPQLDPRPSSLFSS